MGLFFQEKVGVHYKYIVMGMMQSERKILMQERMGRADGVNTSQAGYEKMGSNSKEEGSLV